ncbi:hypothetical protein HZH66_012109 [Vespula vulgaris]|uniref:Uncharacterized protein n=1 Tax=Vespula vulgaris TaxID=7454 RepID=A0A834MVZ4_VESVU|nr:hypothetical protein HZH66_012109 [Vespula vulgaris]
MAVETGFRDGGERTMSISPLVPELRNERAVSRNKRGGEPKLLLEVLPEKTVRVRDNVLGSGQVQIFELLTGSVFALLAPPPPSPPSALPPRPAPSSASYTTPNNDVRVHTTSRRLISSNANRVHRAAATLAIENHQKLRAEFVCFRQISPWRSAEENVDGEEEKMREWLIKMGFNGKEEHDAQIALITRIRVSSSSSRSPSPPTCDSVGSWRVLD